MLAVLAIFAAILLLSVGLTAVEFRKRVPLVFRCRACDGEFRQWPWQAFPQACPSCHARDWATRATRG